jgi:hypothetical protein
VADRADTDAFNPAHSITTTRMDLSERLERLAQGDPLRTGSEAVLQRIMEVDVDGPISATRCLRGGKRTAWRNSQAPVLSPWRPTASLGPMADRRDHATCADRKGDR